MCGITCKCTYLPLQILSKTDRTVCQIFCQGAWSVTHGLFIAVHLSQTDEMAIVCVTR